MSEARRRVTGVRNSVHPVLSKKWNQVVSIAIANFQPEAPRELLSRALSKANSVPFVWREQCRWSPNAARALVDTLRMDSFRAHWLLRSCSRGGSPFVVCRRYSVSLLAPVGKVLMCEEKVNALPPGTHSTGAPRCSPRSPGSVGRLIHIHEGCTRCTLPRCMGATLRGPVRTSSISCPRADLGSSVYCTLNNHDAGNSSCERTQAGFFSLSFFFSGAFISR